MTRPTDEEIAAGVREAVNGLNQALAIAAIHGLKVTIEQNEMVVVGATPRSIMTVKIERVTRKVL